MILRPVQWSRLRRVVEAVGSDALGDEGGFGDLG